MEKEEKQLKCLCHIPRPEKKTLFIFVVINFVILIFFCYKNSNSSYLNYEVKYNAVKPPNIPIYNISLFHIPPLSVKDMTQFYIEVNSDIWCFCQGIDLTKSKSKQKCICANNWFGLDCGIPVAVWNSSFLQEGKNGGIEIRRRKKPRRIIISLAIDDHVDLLDINIHNAFSVVDLFLTVEEKDHSPSVLNMFKNGYLIECQSKIIPLQLNKTLMYKNEVEWPIYMLNELWTVSWNKLADFRPDDILLFSDVSSILSKDVLLFLKLYDGFPEPFFFELRPLLFKFWRQMRNNSASSKIVPFRPSGCTFQFIASMCDFKLIRFFSNGCMKNSQYKRAFEKSHWLLQNWSIGNNFVPSGWHCNLCCKNKCIKKVINRHTLLLKSGKSSRFQNLLENAFLIGNASERRLFSHTNISFDVISSTDPFFAPNVVMKDPKYSYLVDSTPSYVN